MCAPQAAMYAAGVGATVNMFRWSMSLIAQATKEAIPVREKDKSDSRPAENTADSAPRSARTSLADRPNFSSKRPQLFSQQLSLRSFIYRQPQDTSPTAQPFSETGGADLTALESQHFEPVAEVGIETPVAPASSSPLRRLIPCISLIMHTVLLMYFIFTTVLTSHSHAPAAFRLAIYDGIPSGCAAVGVFISILSSLGDFTRARFGMTQRVFYVSSTLIMLLGCVVLLAHHPTFERKPTSIDYITLVCFVFYFLLAATEVAVYPHPKFTSKRNAEGKKAQLSRRAILIMLKPYIWPDATSTSAIINRVRAIITWVCVAAAKICNLYAPILLGKASTALTRGEYDDCIIYVCLYSAVQFAGMFFKESQGLIYLKVAQAAYVQLSEVSFQHLHSLSLDWHLRKKLGEVIRSMDRGISACDTLMSLLFLWLIPAIVECLLVCIIFITYFNDAVLAISTFFFVFGYVVLTIVVALKRKKYRKRMNKCDNDWHDKCTESLINFENVKYFTNEQYEMERYGDAVRKFQTYSVRVQVALAFLHVGQQFIFQACLAVSLSLAALNIKAGRMEIGDFVAVLSYTNTLFSPLNYLGRVYNQIVTAVVDLRNLSELLAETPDVTDAPDAIDLPTFNATDPDVAVEFNDVVFHYPTQPSTQGLKGLSFKMKRGETTAIVGTTGAGKTTVSRLLFRFYDALAGSVKVNGIDVGLVKQKSLRSAIGVVPQVTTMFNDTIKANVLYGRLESLDEDLERVMKSSQLWDFIQSLPSGWDTKVGDRGLKLSGGEKQRTAIARCLLKDPPFVILDEATSSLDTVTENSVQEALDKLGSDRTCLVIAHRLGTIRNADNIIVLDSGKLLEQGTHDELLTQNGKYAQLWNMQVNSTRSSIASPDDVV